ncbi:PP2C family serine/threonine-protein phosphatase [Flavobacterium panacagri]|uniref:PP2C family serine/threonine-protein phosphatase n=1 Tax=Flavobacterium panacagri TaxID=3034146 RepID=UPI0025A4E26F|nr:PP2C family serine/threonine-protein phosphatase [Flavobacterium panacagri]
MEETKRYLQSFLFQNKIDIPRSKQSLFEDFIANETNITAVKIIKEKQQIIMQNWELINRIDDITNRSVFLPNGTVNKAYEAKIDFIQLGWNDIVSYEIQNLENTGLSFDTEKELLSGIPKISGDLKIKLFFKIEGEPEETSLNEKVMIVIVNPDPKSLWKNLESDQNTPFAKEDNVAISSFFLDKKIVVASKRGRSHANVGSFREDDFAFKNFTANGWSVLAVSDGAGSSALSRKGSKLACDTLVEYFEENLDKENLKQFDEILLSYYQKSDPEASKKISHFVYNTLLKAAHFVNQTIEEFAIANKEDLKKFHATLIFTLVKKYNFGYAVLTFGVGDCPIGLLNKDLTEISLMNTIDVGEFGGGTRFITMPEIFQSDKLSSRFGFKLVDDFSYLMLMTDGIYDPKFVVEANLEKIEKWNEFLSDLKGNNEDESKVDFENENEDIASQLSTWMDFWSPGNHDDRTLAIIY